MLKKDRLIIMGGLLVLCIIAWLYIIYLYREMAVMNMDAFLFAMPMTPTWSMVDFFLIFAMVNRQKQETRSPFVPTGYLLCGYFLIWAGFSFLATLLQWFLQRIS